MNGIDAKYRTSHGSHVFLFNFSVADSSSLGVGILLQETPKFRVGLIVFTEARDGLLSVSLRQKMTVDLSQSSSKLVRFGPAFGGRAQVLQYRYQLRNGNLSRPSALAPVKKTLWSSVFLCKASAEQADEIAHKADEKMLVFTNDDPKFTIMNVCGRNDTNLLMRLTTVLEAKGVVVASANLNTQQEGTICNIFRITDISGNKIPEEKWGELESSLMDLLKESSRSSVPAIHGTIQVEDKSRMIKESDIVALEVTAAEMARAASDLVAVERELMRAQSEGAESDIIESKQILRAEASSMLERKISALEAILTTRRTLIEIAEKAAVKETVPDFLLPPPTTTTGPAAGNGYEIIFQGFNWESCKENWYTKLSEMAPELAAAGFTAVWLPPCSDSVSEQGYLPRDLYDLNSKYGTEAELRDLISIMHENGLKVIADIVINHRCAHYQGEDGKWNKFGGRLAWDRSVICRNNPEFGGTGNCKKQEDYTAAPNIDHSQERVRKDVVEWLLWLRKSIGFDGWRFDFVKGYDGKHVGEYIDATVPELAFGEYWDTCSYSDGVLSYNQDAHRQRTVDWCDATGGTSAAFDFTLKGILQEAVSRTEYWRLVDSQGKPPGVLGMWSSRAITFLENHDTGSSLQHWPFPWESVAEGYAYLLTHPGTPCIFFDHFYYDESHRRDILKLIEIRKKFKLDFKCEVIVQNAYNDVYAAVINKKLAMKIGPGHWSPEDDLSHIASQWNVLHSGKNFAVWEPAK